MDTKEVTKPAPDNRDTLFIRNLSYDTDQDKLKEFFEENFGKVTYCLICKDKQTDTSKGTAFVKFEEGAEVATKCLKDYKDLDLMYKFHLDGRNIVVLPALTRDAVKDAQEKDAVLKKEKIKKKKNRWRDRSDYEQRQLKQEQKSKQKKRLNQKGSKQSGPKQKHKQSMKEKQKKKRSKQSGSK